MRSTRNEIRRVHLLGASIGRDWKVDELPGRTGLQGYRFEFTAHYAFDKSEVLRRILDDEAGPPALVVLKECAAWFPLDLRESLRLVRGWVMRCREAGVVPVPATVVPVVAGRSIGGAVRRALRRFRGGVDPKKRLESLLEYNDRLRAYAETERLVVLDLETALRIGEQRRGLRPDLHSGDGLHLNRTAYAILDRLVAPMLECAFSLQPNRGATARPGG